MVKSMRVRSHSYRCSIQPELMIQQPRAPPKQNKDGSWPDPKIAWCKGKTFALALIVDHQEHRLKNSGEYVADWDCILPVVNDVYPRICTSAPKFSDIYPAGLPNANKLRSHYSDRYRTRKSKKWQIKKIDCTPEEIVELEKIAKIVLDAETRLNGLRVAGSDGNIVRDHRAEVKLPNGVPATIWPSDPVIGETLKKKSTGTRKNTKRKRKSEEHESGDEGIEEEEEEEGEEESTAARKKSTATRKPTPTRKTSAPKSRKRKYKSEEELEEEAAQDGESEEYIQAPTARSSLNCRVLPDDRLGTSRLFNKFDSDDEDNEMDNDNEDDADKASVARPTTGGETVVGERSHGPHQNSFEFNYDLSDDEQTSMPGPNVTDENNESIGEDDDYSANEDHESLSEHDQTIAMEPASKVAAFSEARSLDSFERCVQTGSFAANHYDDESQSEFDFEHDDGLRQPFGGDSFFEEAWGF
jgi:hypothetical protein